MFRHTTRQQHLNVAQESYVQETRRQSFSVQPQPWLSFLSHALVSKKPLPPWDKQHVLLSRTYNADKGKSVLGLWLLSSLPRPCLPSTLAFKKIAVVYFINGLSSPAACRMKVFWKEAEKLRDAITISPNVLLKWKEHQASPPHLSPPRHAQTCGLLYALSVILHNRHLILPGSAPQCSAIVTALPR